jgi:hypothetical protein
MLVKATISNLPAAVIDFLNAAAQIYQLTGSATPEIS